MDLAMKEEVEEDVVVLIVVASEEGGVTEVDSVVAEVAVTVEDLDKAKWIPGNMSTLNLLLFNVEHLRLGSHMSGSNFLSSSDSDANFWSLQPLTLAGG